MIGPHFFDQADGAVLDRVELDGIEREQIFLIFGSVFHQVNVVGGTGAELFCKSGADPEHEAAVRHRQVVHHQMMRHAGRNQKKICLLYTSLFIYEQASKSRKRLLLSFERISFMY